MYKIIEIDGVKLYADNNDILSSQIQYFVDATKNNLKVAAYRPNHMGI